ncbi:hypothetical protein B5808_13955 [Cnuibacter physcomitrellae]|uniref:Aminopeptidase N n=2 Tax=Cnuibacter physcomitrellae TaxID=1619308 RepID=A0A1X9LQA3_9MICO|nr:hypothetical protein B5808_13955 [Cnuibacter physcomitrellae]
MPQPTSSPTTTPVDYQPGAAGIGDSYYPLDGNGGYDVQDYALDLAYDPATDVLSGTATITATATQNLSTFNLDFDVIANDGSEAIDISAITVNGADADWSLATTPVSLDTAQPDPALDPADGATPPRTELTVIPSAGLDIGTTITTTVAYSGVPITIDDAFGPAGVFHTADGMVVVGEPRVAATWFPSNDHPADKATMTLRMTVADGLEVVGNGRLVGVTPAAAGTSTWEWRMDQPMAPYLATATVGAYTTTTTTVDGITYVDAIADSLVGTQAGTDAAAVFAKEPEIVSYLSTLFGPYPFAESGGLAVDVPNLYFALENQTRPIYPGAPDESTVVHELAHQWYGDDVSLSRWSDIWLNEGFATYAEWMWSEHTGGSTAQQLFDQQYSRSASSSFWAHEVADPGPAGIFDGYTYNRGAMTLHALRLEVGDDAFFAILQGWASGNAGGNGTTEEFIAYAEQVSGQDLGDLFTAWLYTPSKPALD